jgi:two-component system, cell cycle response regulator
MDFEIIETVLKGMDQIHLIRAKTIASAIPLLTEGKIDLILLDYVLPDGNAFDFMTKAREKGIETPVVVLTEKGNEMIASRLIQQGACDYMTKDFFNGKRISRSILHVLEKTRLKNEIGVAQDRITQMAVMDSLTGLHNRRYLFDTLDREKKRAQRYGADLAVCMIDLDHFKRINDAHGHPAGDTVLSEIGKLLLQWARETDLPCRYGGEEFAVILPETSLEGGRMACERLRRMVAQHGFEHEGVALKVTVSIGIALYDKAVEQTVSDLIKQADEALYRAKKEGRNRVNVNLQTGVP